jgi:hypothetical protein
MYECVYEEPSPGCECGGRLVVHVAEGRFGGILLWATCSGCRETIVPYEGPLPADSAREVARLRNTRASR